METTTERGAGRGGAAKSVQRTELNHALRDELVVAGGGGAAVHEQDAQGQDRRVQHVQQREKELGRVLLRAEALQRRHLARGGGAPSDVVHQLGRHELAPPQPGHHFQERALDTLLLRLGQRRVQQVVERGRTRKHAEEDRVHVAAVHTPKVL